MDGTDRKNQQSGAAKQERNGLAAGGLLFA
jgi:hypothetical protein